jgi:ubiquinone/menaquinone biosynthesis C-methylase UbiE
MDYDKTNMPAAYDAGRGYSAAVLTLWLEVISRAVSKGAVSEILDIGCGTGRYSAALAAHFDARVVAFDPSEKMLAEARRKSTRRVCYARASAESLPLPDTSVDMVFMSMVLHHFDDPDRALEECRRVLRRGGTVCLRAGTVDRIGNYPYVRFFTRSGAILNKVLQSQAFIETAFANAGFQLVRYQLVPSEVAGSWDAYAEKIAFRADSILAQLGDQEFAEGLAALREHAAIALPNEPVIELIDFFVFRPNALTSAAD